MEHVHISENIRRFKTRFPKLLTQSEIAEKAGMSLSTYQKIERGNTIPKVDQLMAIAKALEVPLHLLLAPTKALKSVRFRAQKKMRSREYILVDVGRWLSDFNQLEEILDVHKEYRLRSFSKDYERGNLDPKAAAYYCRKRLNLQENEPIQDICSLLESAGIKIYPQITHSDKFFGLSVSHIDGGPAIVINIWDRISVERWIFSAAHELGHLLLHIDSFNVNQTEENEIEEKEANIFASFFLMPDDYFMKKWSETYGLNFVHRVIKIKRIFKVSYLTVIRRLIDNGFTKDNLYQKFNYQYRIIYDKSLVGHYEPASQPPRAFSESYVGMLRSGEPDNLSDADFKESRFFYLVRKAVEREKISLSRSAEILCISLDRMRNLANSWIDV